MKNEKNINNTICKNINYYIKKSKLTTNEISSTLSINDNITNKIKNNEYIELNIDLIYKFAALFNIKIEELFYDINNKYEIEKLEKEEKFIKLKAKAKDKKHFIEMVDYYISFIKNNLKLSNEEILYITELTLYNKYNNILLLEKEYEKDSTFYFEEFKKMFMYNYYKNVKKISKIIHFNINNFDNIIKNINSNKKRIPIYFDLLNNKNIFFYIKLIECLNINS